MLRRLLLVSPALAAPAGAFRLEAIAPEEAEAYGTGCRRAEWHDGLSAEIDRLSAEAALPKPARAAIDRLRSCPFCGCALAGAALDHGEAPARGEAAGRS